MRPEQPQIVEEINPHDVPSLTAVDEARRAFDAAYAYWREAQAMRGSTQPVLEELRLRADRMGAYWRSLVGRRSEWEDQQRRGREATYAQWTNSATMTATTVEATESEWNYIEPDEEAF